MTGWSQPSVLTFLTSTLPQIIWEKRLLPCARIGRYEGSAKFVINKIAMSKGSLCLISLVLGLEKMPEKSNQMKNGSSITFKCCHTLVNERFQSPIMTFLKEKIAKKWTLENNFPHFRIWVLKTNSHIAISLIAAFLSSTASAMSEIFL